MAHLRRIATQFCRCGKRAAVVLMNKANAPLGVFCQSCGKVELARQNRAERAPKSSEAPQ